MDSQDRWVVVRAIAYSGLPRWRPMLRAIEQEAPRYGMLSEKYLDGKMATLAEFEVPPSPSAFERVRKHLHLDAVFGAPPHRPMLEPSPEVLDMLWGYYFATGGYGPIMHIVAMLPLSARSRRRRPVDRRQHGQIHTGHQCHARPGTARYAQEPRARRAASRNGRRACSAT